MVASMNVGRSSLAGLLLGLGLAGCSFGGGGGGGGDRMEIVSCSLGCAAATNISQISCGVTDIYVNQELRITFTAPVELATVDNNTFQVVEQGTGKTPPGSFSLDPQDPRILIYRPQLTFDSSGNPIFGLTDGSTYLFKLPGKELDTLGPYIQSTKEVANLTRMQCVLVASLGVFDAKPGEPMATVTVDVADITSYDADDFPTIIFEDQPAQNAEDVFRDTNIKIFFDDVMNPATLANPVTGDSDFITVRVDPDGDVTDSSDQVEIPGVFTLSIDQSALTTTLIFNPDASLPSAGSDPNAPRRVLLRLPTTITDLGGNALQNAGTVLFTPEALSFEVVELEELFDDTALEDGERTGSTWALGGALAKGPGGGSGRLGELNIPSGTTVTLNTESEDFSSISDLTVYNPIEIIEPTTFGQPDTVVGGVFQFNRLQIDSGGTLRFEGANPARLLVRGQTLIQGNVDSAGASAFDHDGESNCGGVGGVGGPGAGAGGDGGHRPDGAPFVTAGGKPNTDKTITLYDSVDGKSGGGIAFPDTLSPTDEVTEGSGGLAWPQPTAANPTFHFPVNMLDVTGMEYDAFNLCGTRVAGGAGGGGGHALSGADGVSEIKPFGVDPATPPPDSPGGDSEELSIDDTVKSLDPELGLLRGGSGGGGGGAHLQETRVNGLVFFVGLCTTPTVPPLTIIAYFSFSSAAGGGGGGGLQVQSGRSIILDGVIDASGGDGGSRESSIDLAQPGGGGSGGGVLLQSQQVQLQSLPGRINVTGGEGGTGANGSMAGFGAPGFVRIETYPPVPIVDNEADKIRPDPDTLAADFGADISDVFTIDQWTEASSGFGALSGAQSCWFRPDGNFFQLIFAEDGAELGWDMRLRIIGFVDPQSYRGSNDLFPDSLENEFTNQIGTAPVVVRFQGARILGALDEPCDVALSGGIDSPVFPGSISGWVEHPSELNEYFGSDPSLKPNMIRFVVLWDASQAGYGIIDSIEDLTISVQPD
jgi:hypothetical protein